MTPDRTGKERAGGAGAPERRQGPQGGEQGERLQRALAAAWGLGLWRRRMEEMFLLGHVCRTGVGVDGGTPAGEAESAGTGPDLPRDLCRFPMQSQFVISAMEEKNEARELGGLT